MKLYCLEDLVAVGTLLGALADEGDHDELLGCASFDDEELVDGVDAVCEVAAAVVVEYIAVAAAVCVVLDGAAVVEDDGVAEAISRRNGPG